MGRHRSKLDREQPLRLQLPLEHANEEGKCRNCKKCHEECKEDEKSLYHSEKCNVALHAPCFKEEDIIVVSERGKEKLNKGKNCIKKLGIRPKIASFLVNKIDLKGRVEGEVITMNI